MAKTYEAFLRMEESYERNIPPSPAHICWQCPDLNHTDQIRELHQQVRFRAQNNGSHAFHFVSCRGGEGTSSIVVNLAKFMAINNSDEESLVIDANSAHPVIHTALGVPESPGLTDILARDLPYSKAIHKSPFYNIDVMPWGIPDSSTSRELEQWKFSHLVSELRTRFKYILIDSPPLLATPSSLCSAVASDITFLVVQAYKTHWEVAQKAKSYLEEHGAHISGVILNRAHQVIPEWIYKRL